MIRLLVGADENLEADETHTSNCGLGGTSHSHWTNGAFGFNCEIDNLDMVNGESGSAFIAADQG
jgi:hypothetical protein